MSSGCAEASAYDLGISGAKQGGACGPHGPELQVQVPRIWIGLPVGEGVGKSWPAPSSQKRSTWREPASSTPTYQVAHLLDAVLIMCYYDINALHMHT